MRPIHPFLKRAAQFVIPVRVLTIVQSVRSRNYSRELLLEWGVTQATKELVRAHGVTVSSGPFRGMQYPESSLACHEGIPILFGTYEIELHDVIAAVVANRYERIIDVGSAEGYYAVGLAMRTKTPVFAFECEPRERRFMREMARLNHVADLVHGGSWCSPHTIEKLSAGRRCLVVSDCEGYELKLFQRGVIPSLSRSDLLIELHNVNPSTNTLQVMLDRFNCSHTSRVITFDKSSAGTVVPDRWLRFAREARTAGQQWLYLTSRTPRAL